MRAKRIGNSVAISRLVLVLIVVVIIIVAGVGYLSLSTHPSTSTSTTTTSTSSTTSVSSSSIASSSSTSTTTSSSSVSSTTSSSYSSTSTTSSTAISGVPSVLTYESTSSPQYLDPEVADTAYDFEIMDNVYQSLLFINETSSGGTSIVPWLASNYTVSSDGMTANFTLNSGITFADGEPVNSSAVYFAINRFLIEDGSSPSSHGTGLSYILQGLFNTSLSSALSGEPQTYNQSWVNEVLNEDAVQITGPLTFTIHIQNPTAAFANIISSTVLLLAPVYVMQQDLALWNQSSTGYTLPYPTLSGNLTNQITQYFDDEVATCNAGVTPSGCGTTYLDGSSQGSLAGSGPYEMQSASETTGDVVLVANPHYWGWTPVPEPYNGSVPPIKTVDIKYVPTQTTRELDLENAAHSGQAMTIDLEPENLYDLADRSAWLENDTLQSTVPGLSFYGPYTTSWVYYEPFDMNVTNQLTGTYYTFQPFADMRFRLAFADSVNMSEINLDDNNNLGQVATEGVPPGFPPAGSYNSSVAPSYSYNLTAVQDFLLSAMMQPLTHFTFFNGTAAPPGYFNNTFGCTTLDASGQCANPVPQTITLAYYIGPAPDQAVFEQMASVINNVSDTYNMGLTVDVEPLPLGSLFAEGLSDELYLYSSGWSGTPAWITDQLDVIYSPSEAADGWNMTTINSLLAQAQTATSTDNVTGLVNISNAINQWANQAVMYMWTIYSDYFAVYTSNVHGYYYNAYFSSGYFATEY
jgi:ABC-type transport system substrate-binding protein